MDQGTLNIFLLLFLLIIASCVVVVSFYFIQALKAIIKLSDEWSQIAENIKEKIKLKALAAIPAFLLAFINKIRKRG